ncbi:DUF6179 domain-containing protein [Eubacteriaceae bacterium ES2]|nr:DUF6179 domain-containing protein [Eubacteriaceae bacterium ES2]
MNKILKNTDINPDQLDPAHYCQSLLQLAYLNGLIEETTSRSIQKQLTDLLKNQIEAYTRAQSSSVLNEVAESLYLSILYNISLTLKTFPSPEVSIEQLKGVPLSSLFENGIQIAQHKSNTARILFSQVQKTRIHTNSIAYIETLNQGLHPFFNSYRPRFFAHETPGLNIDYPLLTSVSHLSGVEYFLEFLQRLKLENQFCLCFTPHDIHTLLSSHDENYHDLMINISYQVLKNALVCSHLDKAAGTLRLENQDLLSLSQQFQVFSRETLYQAFEQHLTQHFQAFGLSESCLEYFKLAIPDLAADIDLAIKNQTLDKLFATEKQALQNRILFSTGQAMSPADFRDFIEEFKSCRYESDQVAMIRLSITSLMDLKNILLDAPLSNLVTNQVFNLLSDTDLAAFFQRYIIPHEMGEPDPGNDEVHLRKLLTAYLATQTVERQTLIRSLASQLIISPESFY